MAKACVRTTHIIIVHLFLRVSCQPTFIHVYIYFGSFVELSVALNNPKPIDWFSFDKQLKRNDHFVIFIFPFFFFFCCFCFCFFLASVVSVKNDRRDCGRQKIQLKLMIIICAICIINLLTSFILSFFLCIILLLLNQDR